MLNEFLSFKLFGYQWLYPWVFLFFILTPLIYYFKFKNKKNIKATLQVSHLGVIKKIPPTLKVHLIKAHSILLWISLSFIILALARPQTSDTITKRSVDGLDIVIVLDISDSMLIEDMKPTNRLESAKETIKNFIDQRVSDRIGLVIFAGEAFTLVPPTLDYELVKNRVSEITTAAEARIKDGTAIGVAMAAGAARLKDSNSKNKVMVFLTDGENNSGTIDPNTGLEIAKGYHIKIYSIGLGKSGPTKLPITVTDMFGRKSKRYQNYESTVNDELLQQMADVTSGKYFRAIQEDSLKGVFNEINKLETNKIENTNFVRYTEHFQTFLLIGLFLLILYLILKWTYLRRGP